MSLTLANAIGSMRLIRNGSLGDSLEAIGVNREDYDRLVTRVPWVADDRAVVTRAIDGLAFGVLQVSGIPRFELPAEFLAAILYVFVDPVNLLKASRWIERSQSAADLAGAGGTERVEAPQTFALLVQLANSGETGFREDFEKQCGLRQRAAAAIEGSDGKRASKAVS